MEAITIQNCNLEELMTSLRTIVKEEISAGMNIETLPVEEELLTTSQVADLLGISRVTLHKYKTRGIVKSYRLGSRVRFKKSEILAGMESIFQK